MAKQPPDQPATEGTPADKPAPDHITGTAPEELAKTSNPVPPGVSSAALLAEFAKLPQVAGTDGLRANAEYYAKAPREELLNVLRGLKIDDSDEGGKQARDELVKRVESGSFGK